MASIGTRMRWAWNAFRDQRDPYKVSFTQASSSNRPDRARLSMSTERSIVNAVYSRIANDIASIDIRHVRLDENKRFSEFIEDSLDSIFTLEANIDQSGRDLIRDTAMTMFDAGSVAMVPVDTDGDPYTESYKIKTIRCGKIVQWMPQDVRVNLYNDRTGYFEEIVLPKRIVTIIENPFYPIMNEPNGTVRRLIRKMNMLDAVDEQSSSGKLDLIIQLPYTIKTEARRTQAENRRKDIETQLAGSKYGIAYTDGTEHITQLNRSLDNNLMHQVEYLQNLMFSQLGFTEEIMNGSASPEAMQNYYSRIIEPCITAIVEGMRRKFLSQTARSQGQTIMFFRDPFKLVPVDKVADMADKFTRNEILSSNEFRGIIGYKPSKDPAADELRNKNLNQSKNEAVSPAKANEQNPEIKSDE